MASLDLRNDSLETEVPEEVLQEALSLHLRGKLPEAERAYFAILDRDRSHFVGLHNLGLIRLQQGQYDEAIRLIGRALEQEPDSASALNNFGHALMAVQRHAEAMTRFEQALALDPDLAEVNNNLGSARLALGRPAEAMARFERALALKADFPEAHNNLGTALLELDCPAEAASCFERALALKADFAEAHINLGRAMLVLERPDAAISRFEQALALKPDHPEARNNLTEAIRRQEQAIRRHEQALADNPNDAETHYNLGVMLQGLGRNDEAMAHYEQALALKPDHAMAHNNLGVALQGLGRLDEAMAHYQEALATVPDFAEAHSNLGFVLQTIGRLAEAVTHFEQTLAANPGHAIAHNNLGNAMLASERAEEAVAHYDRALAAKPDFPEAHNNRAAALSALRRIDEAVASYEKAIALKPDFANALGMHAHLRRHICDWQGIEAIESNLVDQVQSHGVPTGPFPLLAITDDQAIQLHCARQHWESKKITTAPVRRYPERNHAKLRLGYFSADLRDHAMGYLMARLFERHDRSQFEVFAFSFGVGREDEMRQRLEKAFDRFFDVRPESDDAVARLITEQEIDILIDLMGHTSDNRLPVLAQRPAPVQVHYLGYPGTLGVDFIDYMIVDPFIVPPDQQRYFTERLVYLPDTYQVNDDRRQIGERRPTRSECGLPEDGFVFCSFNNSYKITPQIFSVWMRLLTATPDSVLWLLADNRWAEENLRREAAARGVHPSRLVFAPRLKLPEHLARHPLADLFLDTLPFNAHTTASDALWTGLPVLTCAGRSFAARVAGSLLNAVGLPELITHDLAAYEALALKLARDRDSLKAIRQKLEANKATAPLFDTDRTRRHIEAAYLTMWDNWRRG